MSSLLLLLLIVVVLLMGVRVVGEGQRLAIMRLGQYAGIRGPGVVWVLPIVDSVTRIDLDRDFPSWRGWSAEELASEIKRRITT